MKVSFSLSAIDDVARQLLEVFPDERVFAFFGSMGVGKTTLIKSLCQHLGVSDNVCSPTFAIVNQYRCADGSPVYHFDFYRIKNLDEAFDIGCDEYFYSGGYCFTEWTELVEPLLPERYVRVTLVEQSGLRTLEAEAIAE